MHDFIIMAVTNCRKYLFHRNCSPLFIKLICTENFIKQFSSVIIFAHYIKIMFILKEFINFHDIWVILNPFNFFILIILTSFFRILTSFINLCCSSSFVMDFSMIFIALVILLCLCIALLTSPKDPS